MVTVPISLQHMVARLTIQFGDCSCRILVLRSYIAQVRICGND